MATYTEQAHEDLTTTEDRAVANAHVMLRHGFGVDRVQEYLTRQAAQVPGLGTTRVQCSYCGKYTDTPIRDSYATFWVGEQAAPYCDFQCLDRAAEAEAEGRWTA